MSLQNRSVAESKSPFEFLEILNVFCRLLIFSKYTFLKNSFRNTISVSNSLNPDQAAHNVGPDLGPNCLPRLLADDTCRQSVIQNRSVAELMGLF